MGEDEQELVADPRHSLQLSGLGGSSNAAQGSPGMEITPNQSKTTNLCLWREHPTGVTYQGTAACEISPGIFLFYRLLARVRR